MKNNTRLIDTLCFSNIGFPIINYKIISLHHDNSSSDVYVEQKSTDNLVMMGYGSIFIACAILTTDPSLYLCLSIKQETNLLNKYSAINVFLQDDGVLCTQTWSQFLN